MSRAEERWDVPYKPPMRKVFRLCTQLRVICLADIILEAPKHMETWPNIFKYKFIFIFIFIFTLAAPAGCSLKNP